MKKRELLERDIEKDLNTKAAKAGWWSLKFTSPQRRAVPDRILLGSKDAVNADMLALLKRNPLFKGREVDPRAFEALAAALGDSAMAGCVTFVECKRPGAKPTVAQEREHAKLRARGFTVLVVDTKEQIDGLYGNGRGDDLV
jgi:hypothetical protein